MKKALLLFLLLPFWGFGKNLPNHISKDIAKETVSTSPASSISESLKLNAKNDLTSSLETLSACTTYAVSSVSTTDACSVGKQSTVTVTSTAASLPTGTYTVEYSLSYNGYSTTYNATMTVTTAGSGTFTSDLSIMSATQTTKIRISKLTSGSCSNSVTANNESNTLYMAASKGAPTANSGYASCNDWIAQWNNDSVDGYYLDVAIDNTFTSYVSGYQNLYIAGYPSGYTLTGLAHGGTYYYRVRSKNYCGTSANSNVVSFTEKGNGSSTPGTISGGASSICVGASTTFTVSGSNPSGGTWSIFNQSGAATITSAGKVTGTAPGTVTVVYTVGSGCVSSTTQSLTITGGVVGSPSSTPTVCINTALTPITHTTSGFTGIGSPTNLPSGVNASFSSNTITISGTPLASGTFNYSIPLTGGSCGTANATGTITVTPANTITLSSATGTNAQTLCLGSSITTITYTTTGATGATFSGLPAGLTTSFASNTVTISGTPSATNASPYTYTVTLTGGCGTVTATGTIRVNPTNTISLSSASGTNAQTICISSPITPITYTTANATGATFSGLPSGVNGSFASNTVTISGSPSVSSASPYNYTVTLTGGCGTVTATGTITVTPANTITLSSATGTNAQTLCLGSSITTITYTTTGATGATFSGLPAGLTTSFASNTVTISGTPSATNASPYTYTVTLTGGCGTVTTTGTIRVNPILTASVTLTHDQSSLTICQDTNVRFTATPTNGGTSPTYQWYNGTTLLTETSNSYLAYNLKSTDIIKAVMTSNATPCLTGSPATSNTFTFNVITTDRGRTQGGKHICQGTATPKFTLVNFDAPNQGAAYSYPTKVVRWEYSDNNNVTWIPIPGTSGLIEYQPTDILTANRNYRAVTQTSGCSTEYKAIETGMDIDPIPTVTFTAQPGATACTNTNVTYTTQSGQYNYAWTVPGVNNTDYTIVSGGIGTTSNTITLKWLTTGSKTVTVNYKNGNTGTSCSANTATASTPTTVSSPAAAPTVGTVTQPSCTVATGSVVLSNLPNSGTLIYQGSNSTSGTYTITGTTMTISGLVPASYTFAVSNACAANYSSSVTIESAKKWNGTVWSNGNTEPTSNDILEFDADYTLDKNINGCSVTIANGAKVTIAAGRTLNITNAINVNSGSLTFENTASLVQTNNVANTGNITYKRNITVRRYDLTYWSSPVTTASGLTMHDLSPNTLLDKYFTWDPAAGWAVNLNGTQVMTSGKGYSIRAPQPFDITTAAVFVGTFTGVPTNGDVSFTPAAGSWNLIGNPYPSAVDAKLLMQANSNLGALYFWTHNSLPSTAYPGVDKYNYTSADYAVYTMTGSTASSTGGLAPTKNIGAGQSFFAKTTTASPIVFTNAMRLVGSNTQFYKSNQTEDTDVNRVWLNLTNTQGVYKQVLIGYLDGATNNWDINYDAATISGNTYADFYSINDSKKLTIQGRAMPFDNTEVLPLGYKSTVAGEMTIAIDHTDGFFNDQAVYLEDKTTGKIVDLKAGNYTFSTEIGTFTERLFLRYTNKTLGTGDFENLENSILVSVKDKVIKLTSSTESIKDVAVFDISGKQLYTKNKIGATELQISNLQSGNQVLLIKVILDNGYTTTKKIIFN